MVLDKAFDLLLKATQMEEKVLYSEVVIRTLKKLNLDPEHPPVEFDGVYAYAVVEYAYNDTGTRKPSALIRIFRTETVKQAFRQALDSNTPQDWLLHASELIETGDLGRELRSLGFDAYRELATFAQIFLEIARRSRTPKEVLAEQKVDSLQRQMLDMQKQLHHLPFAELQQSVNSLTGANDPVVPTGSSGRNQCSAAPLAQQLLDWFDVLGYGVENSYEIWERDYFELLITIPVRRKRYDRIIVRGIAGQAELSDVQELYQVVTDQNADEGWLVSNRRITPAARNAVAEGEEYDVLSCYTFDELLDEDANFDKYIAWLENEIERKGIETSYVPLACTKAEVHPVTKQKIGTSHYGKEEGWIEVYVDQWLDDPAKEHLSVLGEFGSGKTWFALNYAWLSLQKYKTAKQRGTERPRLPLVIPLRDYAKAVNAESLFSEFFFRKHEIPLPGYTAFEQLNRMGKLLLIFDGFDEMAARVDRQSMINNFWELAKVVVPGSKAILTCRTEHFPEAQESRRLLNAELKASTKGLTGETPQFEVLELEKFNDVQIRAVLGHQAKTETIDKVMSNPQLLDLARRPVLTEMIIAALPDIKAGKPIDMSRIYLYAVCSKMEQDIKAERTFTSMSDKLFFLCELSWEMLSTDRMSINYREFPDRIRQLFGATVTEEKDLDHWQYDMMGQTMLIRNADGDYTPAHRSLLEFFVAYKFAAELGVIAEDFISPIQTSKFSASELVTKHTWAQYCLIQAQSSKENELSDIISFQSESIENLRQSVGHTAFSKAVFDLIRPMIPPSQETANVLFSIIANVRHKTEEEVGYLCGNILRLLVDINPHILEGRDLTKCAIIGSDFSKASLRNSDFSDSLVKEAQFMEPLCTVLDVKFSADNRFIAAATARGQIKLWDLQSGAQFMTLQGHTNWVRSIAITPDCQRIISAGDDRDIRVWNVQLGECIRVMKGHIGRIRALSLSPDSRSVASVGIDKADSDAIAQSSNSAVIKIWDIESGTCTQTIKAHTDWIMAVGYSSSGDKIATGCRDSTMKLWNVSTGELIQQYDYHTDRINTVAFSPDDQLLVSGGNDQTLYVTSLAENTLVHTLTGHTDGIRSVCFSTDGRFLVSAGFDEVIRLWDMVSGDCIRTIAGHSSWVRSVMFSNDGELLISGGDDQTIKVWEANSGQCLKTFQGYAHLFLSLDVHPSLRFFVSGSKDSAIRFWNIDTGECIHSFDGDAEWVNCVRFSPDGKLLATNYSDRGTLYVSIWDIESSKRVSRLSEEACSRKGRVLLFTQDGRSLITGSDDAVIKIWDVATGKCLKELNGHTAKISTISISSSSNLLASAGEDCNIRLWNLESYEEVNCWNAHTSGVWSIDFHPDGKRLVSGSRDHHIAVWDISSTKRILLLEGHSDRVKSVAFSPDGQYIVSGSHDRTLRVWLTETGECIQVLEGHTNWVSAVKFFPDSHLVVSASEDGTMRVWDIDSANCLRTIRPDRPYEKMNITRVKGLSGTEKTVLQALGAYEN